MLAYIIRRGILSVLTVIIITSFVFIVIHLVPGNIVDIMMGTQNFLSQSQKEALYKAYGINQPLLIQYITWLKSIISLNLGESLRSGQPVVNILEQTFPVTFELSVFSIILSLLIGIPLGIISALKNNSWIDRFIRSFSLAGISSPSFWIGALLIILVSSLSKNYSFFGYVSFFKNPIENIEIFFLPALTLGLMIGVQIIKIARSSLISSLQEDYIRTARSKGLKEDKIIWKHALRNAIIPVITMGSVQFGYLLGGAVVIEDMFALPGMGRAFFQAVSERDYPVVQGIVLFIAMLIVLLNFIMDVIYTLIDPRINLN